MHSDTLMPPACLGVLGGGQLGRFFVRAAHDLGYRVVVLDPDRESPAGKLADHHLVAEFDDNAALDQLATMAQAVTTEFENVPADVLRRLGERIRVAPYGDSVAICQNRIREKQTLASIGAPHAPYYPIRNADEARDAPTHLFPGILKTAASGYDGKGQIGVCSRDEVLSGWRRLEGCECVLEQRLTLAAEMSVVLARDFQGQLIAYPAVENRHRGGILDLTIAPASPTCCPPALQKQAIDIANRIAVAIDYVGVLAVEFFVSEGRLWVNEMAPRPHNSGHVTLDNGACSQFEQQVRVLAGLPLGAAEPLTAAVMVNCLGDLWRNKDGVDSEPNWPAILQFPGLHLHLYGKSTPRPGRKMGHFTVCAASSQEALDKALTARELIGISDR